MNLKILVQTELDASNQSEALKAIAKTAFDNNILNHQDDITILHQALLEREKVATTAFEDGFAIPHAQINEITEPTVLLAKFKNSLQWYDNDDNKVEIAIALLIPKSDASKMHMDVLSKVAVLLLNEEFRKTIKSTNDSASLKEFLTNKLLSEQNSTEAKNNNFQANAKFKIVGVPGCATGVAHTYMAKDALEKAGQELGWDVKIETQGQKGIEFRISDEEIAAADAVIFATDIYVDPERFMNKKFLQVKTNDAIHNPKNVLEQSLKQEVVSGTNGVKNNSSNKATGAGEFKSTKIKIFMGHLLSGVSRMIPFIVFSGILWAIFNSIERGIPDLANSAGFNVAFQATQIGFTVFIAMMGGFIAESIAGRAGFAVGFIATFAAANPSFYFWWGDGIPQIDWLFPDEGVNNVGLSLFAAIMMGFSSGSLVKWVNSWKVHKMIAPIMPIIFIPVVCSAVLIFPFIFLLSGPLGFLMNGLVYGIAQGGKITGLNFVIGCLLGAMIGFDMGGPVNKIAGTTATALITIDPRLMGSVAAAIPIAPIGVGVATLIARKLFTTKEKAEGVTALGLGFFGISEGAIPFAVNRPKKVLIANLVGSSIAGGLAFLFFVGGYVGMWGGPITAFVLGVKAPVKELASLGTTIPSAFGGGGTGMEFLSILWFFIAIIAGAIIHAFLFIFLIKLDKEENRQAYQQRFADFRKKLSFKKQS